MKKKCVELSNNGVNSVNVGLGGLGKHDRGHDLYVETDRLSSK